MRWFVVIGLMLVTSFSAYAADQCQVIYGRASLSGGDLNLRIWYIGTHHEFEPDNASWDRVIQWLNAGATKADKDKFNIPASNVYLFGDFKVCPVEPFKQGSVQRARIEKVEHKHYATVK
jgi:hypothetical protein